MLKKKAIFILTLTFLLTSCADSWDAVKRGLTGQKRESIDEFLVQKKDPLILPPDFENLPLPGKQRAVKKKISSFDKTLTTISSDESDSSSASSAEQSILYQIKKK
tara:strand:- start:111 stop:428 length:318 start_codon:yes stop_codon:yes gene_type:complete